MSFAGHVLDMINRQKQNRELLTAHRDRAKYVRDKYLEYGVRKYDGVKPSHRTLSAQEKQLIRETINREYRIARFKSLVFTAMAIMLIVYILLWLFN